MNNIFNIAPTFLTFSKFSARSLRISVYPKYYSTEQAVKTWEESEKNKQLLKDFESISNIYTRKKTKKPQKPPFLKNVFLGKFDTDILTYPELDKEELERLNKILEPTKNYFTNLPPLQKPPDIKSDFMENLRRLRLFGLQGPQTLDARELNVTENCRFNDVLSSNSSAMMGLLCNDKLVFQALLKHGTEEQKKKYLSNLISGEYIGAFCVTEDINGKDSMFNTTATLTDDKNAWILNGEKSYIVNGNIAHLLLVLAKTEVRNMLGVMEPKLTLFIVEKDFGGITTETCDAMGLQATDFANIRFNNTRVPAENVLGLVNMAEQLLPSVLTDYRLSTGPACSGILRQLINKTVQHCTHITIENRSLAEAENVQSLLAKLTIALYAIESITYLASSLMDEYENQDCQMEALVVKIYSSQQTCSSTLNTMEMLGPSTYMKDHWCNVLHRDALSHLILHEPSENLKLTVSLLGLQHTGVNIQEKIKKIRNPLFYPADAFKRLWAVRKQIGDDPRLTLHLPEYLHPSLFTAAQRLEYSVLRFEYAVECFLARSGKEVINKHMELQRLAECLIDIYVMTACLGRASRSYCIGLPHADMEMSIANAISFSAVERIREKLSKVCRGPYSDNDESYKTIAGHLFKVREYFPVHPLTRNY